MKLRNALFIALTATLFSVKVQACPFTLINDREGLKIFITDRDQGGRIEESKVRNPILHGKSATIGGPKHTTTYIYVQRLRKNGNTDYVRVTKLVENFCTQRNKFKYSELNRINNMFPTRREHFRRDRRGIYSRGVPPRPLKRFDIS